MPAKYDGCPYAVIAGMARGDSVDGDLASAGR